MKNKLGIVLVLLIFIAFFAADGIHVINYPPQSVHMWRQSDCAAYARRYYETNSGLLSPSFYNLVAKDGRSISEFPVIYYIAGKLFHVFGMHYWILRGLTFFCYIIGLLYLFKCVQFWIKDPVLELFVVIIFATTPYFYYYALNFLPNVPAIAFSFPGLYYMLRYRQSDKRKYLVVSTLFFILSTILKPTDGGILWMAFASVICSDAIFKKQKSKQTLPIIVAALVVGISIFAWYKYAVWYNAVNDNTLNILGIYPLWDMTKNDVLYTITQRMTYLWGSSYQQLYILCLLPVFFIIYIVKWKSLNEFLKKMTLFLMLGSLVYAILWFHAFSDLDYYQLINVVAPLFLCITVVEYYDRKIGPLLNKNIKYSVATVAVIIMAGSIYHNRNVQNERFHGTVFSYVNPALFEVEPYLRKIGVAATDTVVGLPDASPNILLNGFGNVGYSALFFGGGVFTIDYCKQHGARYMIITDSGYLHNPAYEPYTSKKIGEYKGIYVFDLK